MRFVPMTSLLAAGLLVPTVAQAEDNNLRFKVDTAVFSIDTYSSTAGSGDNKSEGSITSSGLSLGGAPARLYGGYKVGKGLELGAAVELGMRSSSYETSITTDGTTVDDDGDLSTDSRFGLLACFSWNKAIGDGLGFYAQPKAGVFNNKSEPDTGDSSGAKYILFGAEAGLHINVVGKASIELGAEYLGGSGNSYADGDKVDDASLKASLISLRTGARIKF